MAADNCIICGAEGRQLCTNCKEKLAPLIELLRPMYNRVPVEYNGSKYGCISALTIRARASSRKGFKQKYILQAELMSKRANSLTIADPKDVKVLKEWRPPNE